MPTSFNEEDRPAPMQRNDRPLQAIFAAQEVLYRRCDPEYIDTLEDGTFRVLDGAFREVHALSALRSALAEPDHARWDSAADPENEEGFVPQLYRDWYVVGIPVNKIPPELTPARGVVHQFEPTHVPFADSYGHSEVRAKKNGVVMKGLNKFKNDEIRTLYRTILAEAGAVILLPDQVAPNGAQISV